MKTLRTLAFLLIAFISPALAEDFLPGVKRVLFLGDSITYAGRYTELFDAFIFTQFPDRQIKVIDCGLPSETVSGLSEAGHAGGKFPRPDVHERLDRVLATVKPDLVFACYGMNCGIYLPFDEKRFAAYQAGIRKLREKVEKAGAKIIHLTPPVFDAVPLKGRTKTADVVKDGEFFEGYNGVLDRYSAWLVEQGKAEGWRVIDTHSAMAAALAEKRKTDPGFFYAKDGVHANNDGHRVIAEAILSALSPEKAPAFFKLLDSEWAASTKSSVFFDSLHKRNRVLCDSYLTRRRSPPPRHGKRDPHRRSRRKSRGARSDNPRSCEVREVAFAWGGRSRRARPDPSWKQKWALSAKAPYQRNAQRPATPRGCLPHENPLPPLLPRAFHRSPLPQPEAFEVGPDQKSALPGGREADGIIGDFILRNDKIEAVISGNLPLRRANMSTFYGDTGVTPGCIYDLTLRGENNDQLTIFQPAQQQGTVSWVRVSKDGKDGEALVECVSTSPGRDGVSRSQQYRLRDGWSGVSVTTVITNEGAKPRNILLSDKWTNFVRTGSATFAHGPIQWAESVDPADRCGYAAGFTEDKDDAATKTMRELAPGASVTFTRFLAVGRSPAEAVGLVAEKQGDAGKITGTVKDAGGAPVAGAHLIVRQQRISRPKA